MASRFCRYCSKARRQAFSLAQEKGRAIIRQFGLLFQAELHWYEAHGLGKVDMKIKHKTKL